MKILGIDDNADIITGFAIAFTSTGHEFSSTLSGREGLRLIRENRYDVVLLDLAMPEFSGVELLIALEQEKLLGKQKIIIVTASSMVDSELESFKTMGVSECLRKPVDLDELVRTTEEVALGKRPACRAA